MSAISEFIQLAVAKFKSKRISKRKNPKGERERESHEW